LFKDFNYKFCRKGIIQYQIPLFQGKLAVSLTTAALNDNKANASSTNYPVTLYSETPLYQT